MNDESTKQSITRDEATTPQQTASPVGLGILGALAGAAVGAYAAIYLSDVKNREQLQKQISLFRDRAIKVMDTFAEQGERNSEISKKLDDVEKTVHTIQK